MGFEFIQQHHVDNLEPIQFEAGFWLNGNQWPYKLHNTESLLITLSET